MLLGRRSSQKAELIARYAATLHVAARTEHHVVSALGAWLVLAVAGQAATADPEGGDAGARRAVGAALGLPVVEAGRVAVDLLTGLPPAVAAVSDARPITSCAGARLPEPRLPVRARSGCGRGAC